MNAILRASVCVGALAFLSAAWVEAGPSLPVTKPPVQPTTQMTGPPVDPQALRGQWFIDAQGIETVRSNEFHDNLAGGWAGVYAISGYVDSVTYAPVMPPAPIVAFSIQATIINDTTNSGVSWLAGNNRHGESQGHQGPPYAGPMADTKLSAEFAVTDPTNLPLQFTFPYAEQYPLIEAVNEDQAGWYCWNPQDPDPAHKPPGSYFVPTWDFGTIQRGQSATRQLQFIVPAGLPSTDPRYSVIVQSHATSNDVLLNRTTSLKISTWMDQIAPDTGQAYPHFEESVPYRSSDVSVFHNTGVEEEEPDLDFGDAPSPYPTLLAANGARHVIVPGVFMGALVDAEADGQPTPNSDGDDLNPPLALDDEDGVALPPAFVAGSVAQVGIVASVPGHLNAWIDWNANGSWLDPGEQVVFNLPMNAGLNSVTVPVPVPPALVAGGPHSRWRFTTYAPAAPAPTGLENDGEVEDHEVRLEVLDFGDAPDPAYPTLFANNGARHRIPSAYWLGAVPPDLDPDGQFNANATGDDLAGVPDDEDGVAVLRSLVIGSNGVLNIVASTNTGYLNAWIDFNANGSWLDVGEQIASDLTLPTGANSVTAAVPAAARVGPAFARFRFSSAKGLTPTGLAGDGEVEDHLLTLYQTGPSAGSLVITNVVLLPATNAVNVQWAGQSGVTYEAHYAVQDLADTGLVWTAWGGYVTAAPYEQADTNVAPRMKSYRVVAPYAPPPP